MNQKTPTDDEYRLCEFQYAPLKNNIYTYIHIYSHENLPDNPYFSLTSGDAKVSFSYLELGGNYYFTKAGKGLYGHVSYGNIGFKGTYTDPSAGEGEGKATISLVNLKLGAKLGNTLMI